MFDDMTQMITKHLALDQSTEIRTPNLQLNFQKSNVSTIQTSFSMQDGAVNLPSFCDLLSNTGGDCQNSIIIQKSMMMNMALTGQNGDNETHIGSSKSISYSLYDENKKEIPIKDQQKPLEYWIPKDPTVPVEPYKFIDALNATMVNDTTKFLYMNGTILNGFRLTGSNVSVHIQIRPDSTNSKNLMTTGYLLLLKFGDTPGLDVTTKYFDEWSIYCPSTDLLQEYNDSYYLFFMNISRVNSFNGYVGYSIRELNSTQLSMVDCNNKTDISALNTIVNTIDFSSSSNISTFTNNFYLRVYSAGCYYMDTTNNKWSTYGMEILGDTNITHTHCQSNHLTSFAGGFVVLPNEINFNNVWANADFTKNPVIYITCIVLVSLYLLLAVWARYQDSRDEKKMGVVLLDYQDSISSLGGLALLGGANIKEQVNKYIYEIIVLTGSRKDAGTESKVSCIITSESSETDIIDLKDSNPNMKKRRKVFNRAGVDSFLLALDKPLGSLTSIRIWHDNSGIDSQRSSWYLKYVIVHDLQTRDKNYFICDKWLAIDKEDSLIERVLPISLQEQKTQFKYLLAKQTKQKLSDGHLWFSIFARPVQSSFNRLDRLTCCFVLLAISMLMNILYYGMANQANKANGLQIGPFINITPEQVT